MIRSAFVMATLFASFSAFACPGGKCDEKGNCPRGCAMDESHKEQKKTEGEHQCKNEVGGKACHADAEKICGKESLKDRSTLHKCLDANKDKLSKECKQHLNTER